MTPERIAELRTEQVRLRAFADAVDTPAVLLLAYDESLSIRGNEAGLIRFAGELLEVASGGGVNPAISEWLHSKWLPLESIVLDPDPKIEEPAETMLGKMKAHLLLGLIIIGGIGLWLLGAITLVRWLERL